MTCHSQFRPRLSQTQSPMRHPNLTWPGFIPHEPENEPELRSTSSRNGLSGLWNSAFGALGSEVQKRSFLARINGSAVRFRSDTAEVISSTPDLSGGVSAKLVTALVKRPNNKTTAPIFTGNSLSIVLLLTIHQVSILGIFSRGSISVKRPRFMSGQTFTISCLRP